MSDTADVLSAVAGHRPCWPLVEPTPRWIRVRPGDSLVADSRRALLHVQYGPGQLPRSVLPTYFLPPDDVRVQPVPGETASTCPYKGIASWWSARVGDRLIEDIAWSYPSPVPENPRIPWT